MGRRILVFVAVGLLSAPTWCGAVPGDINGDGQVNFADFLILAQNYGKTGEPASPDTVTVRDTLYVPTEPQERPPEQEWSDVAALVRPTVYWLGVTGWGNYTIKFLGTGFAIADNAICTNYHVASAASANFQNFKPEVRPAFVAIKADGRPTGQDMYYLAVNETDRYAQGWPHPEYDGSTLSADVAVVLLHPEEKKIFPAVATLIGMKEAKEINIGDEIATIGYPGELEVSYNPSDILAIPTLKIGTVSALRPYKTEYLSANPMGRVSNKLIQHNFDTTGGTSGSPIFNRRGEIVAVNHAMVLPGTGSLGFGVRADEVRHVMQALSVEAGLPFPNAEKPAAPATDFPDSAHP
ncbi:MAG: trypsin-like peptidase domain-containing protein [bacterium]